MLVVLAKKLTPTINMITAATEPSSILIVRFLLSLVMFAFFTLNDEAVSIVIILLALNGERVLLLLLFLLFFVSVADIYRDREQIIYRFI